MTFVLSAAPPRCHSNLLSPEEKDIETPTITGSAYASATTTADKLFIGNAVNMGLGNQQGNAALLAKIQPTPAPVAQPKEKVPMSTARIVKVFIADSNDNLPLDKRVLHTGDEQLTDLTDQELFFEVPIVDLLAKHNAVRATTADKKQTEKFGREIFLEPARIRDLKMVVVTVAQF